ncbi:NUDIX hydrolase domain-like protein [Stachybotrys elegans]|uniref:NAD(+) diphosphatase n=1 Tax=Stachybotrys elegans TaxID=80388 RepID=A0A8K0SWA7_9HYPO|nr:NUDIX hydrolase domain-like protein [Stachybotrys elegans]
MRVVDQKRLLSMSGANPALPEIPSLLDDDSMLTRKFGKEVVNYYAGGSLNRYSFLRPDLKFLNAVALSPETKYIALNNLSPLVTSSSELAFFSYEDLKSVIGTAPFGLAEEEYIQLYDSTKSAPLIVFLGMDESGQTSTTFETSAHGSISGKGCFAIDVTAKGFQVEAASAFLAAAEQKGIATQGNPRSMTLHAEAAAMFAQARSMMDWNIRNAFCASCGNPTLSVHAGYKRVCPPTDLKGTEVAVSRGECPSRKGVSNVCFPRTDPTMIAAVVSTDGQRVLLGRQARFPPCWYSTLAGFIEPGESIEEAVRREVWEESGVKVGRVVIHSSQPWPYPSSLMIGAIAQALPGDGEKIILNDKELQDAKWFSMDEVREALLHGTSALDAAAGPGYKEGALRLPPGQAIANQLISAVANGFLTASPRI